MQHFGGRQRLRYQAPGYTINNMLVRSKLLYILVHDTNPVVGCTLYTRARTCYAWPSRQRRSQLLVGTRVEQKNTITLQRKRGQSWGAQLNAHDTENHAAHY